MTYGTMSRVVLDATLSEDRDNSEGELRFYCRDKLIWQIEEYLYPTSILGIIYHIRADAFIFFGL